MFIASKLGKTEDEIAGWPLRRLARWMAFFKIVQEEESKAIERVKNKNKPPIKGSMSF